MPHDVFISYSQKDRRTANAVCHALESHGVRCWMAPRDIEPGKEWMPAIAEALTNSKVLVLVFSSRANGSRHVAREVSIAFNEQVPIIPFRIEEVPLSTALKYAIATTHWLDALTPPLEEHLETLVAKVRSILGSESAARGPGAATVSGTPAGRGARRPWTLPTASPWVALGGGVVVVGLLLLAVWTATGGDAGQSDPEPGGVVLEPAPGEGPRPPEPHPVEQGLDRPSPQPIADAPQEGGRGDVARPEEGVETPPRRLDRAEPSGAPPAMDVQTATALLDRAVGARDLSMQGQVQALESLLASGFEYSGADLAGIRLTGANISEATLTRAVLAGTDLSASTASAVDLRQADLRFANLEGADLSSARLQGAYAGFVDAGATIFRDAEAEGTDFYGARLRGADFRNADLRGASFIMADLRDARMEGANFEDALLYGAFLDGATFAGANLRNTEATAAALSPGQLTGAQLRGLCTSEPDREGSAQMMDIRLIERIPNSRFSGGIEYSPLTHQGMFGLRAFSTQGLAPCGPRSEDNPGIWVADGVSHLSTDWGAAFDTELISSANRRRDWVLRIEEHMRMMMDTLNARHGH